MTTTDLAILGSGTYEARITPLKSGGRRDVEVSRADTEMPAAFGRTGIIAQLHLFFAALDEEASAHEGDPVATAQALARMESLLADVRYVRDHLKTLTANALQTERIRRLTVSGIVTVESSTETRRTNWDHPRLLADALTGTATRLLNIETGEVLTAEASAARLLELITPSWKMTGLRDIGIDPDLYCAVETDDDGKAVRTPTVRMVDNLARSNK